MKSARGVAWSSATLILLALVASLLYRSSVNDLSIAGIAIGMTMSDVRSRLGEPHKVVGHYEAYVSNSGIVEITFDKVGTVDRVSGFNTSVDIGFHRFGPDASIDQVESVAGGGIRRGRVLTYCDDASLLEIKFSDKMYAGLQRRTSKVARPSGGDPLRDGN